jgi:hypothetical protein
MISVGDLTGAQLANMDRNFMSLVGESGKLAEFLYPQLLGQHIALHPPSFMYAMFSLFKVRTG